MLICLLRAQGLILSLSLIFAAGAAAYENPQIKKWVDDNRRKIAQALHQLGDELAPQPQRRPIFDASIREDDSPEAVERRRRAREEILERGRVLDERRRSTRLSSGRPISFDDLVHKDGSLREDEAENAVATAAEPAARDSGLRHRGDPSSMSPAFTGSDLLGSAGSQVLLSSDEATGSRSPTPTLPISPPVPPKPEAYRAARPLIDTEDSPSSPMDELVSLTPTTSSSSAATDLAELDQDQVQSSRDQYMPVNEWAHNQSVQSLDSFHSPPQSVSRSSTPTLESASVADSVEHASQAGTEDADVMSEFEEGINTPSTWTEIGSQFSEE